MPMITDEQFAEYQQLKSGAAPQGNAAGQVAASNQLQGPGGGAGAQLDANAIRASSAAQPGVATVQTPGALAMRDAFQAAPQAGTLDAAVASGQVASTNQLQRAEAPQAAQATTPPAPAPVAALQRAPQPALGAAPAPGQASNMASQDAARRESFAVRGAPAAPAPATAPAAPVQAQPDPRQQAMQAAIGRWGGGFGGGFGGFGRR